VAIMKFSTPPGGDQEDRRAHVVGHGDGVALAHAAFGDKVQGGAQINAINPNYELATKWSTAPYTGPDAPPDEPKQVIPNQWGYRDPSRAKKCMGNDDTCNSWAQKGSAYCVGHNRQRGLASNPGAEASRYSHPSKNGIGPVKPSIVADERRGEQ
jgi:hypothetical protein